MREGCSPWEVCENAVHIRALEIVQKIGMMDILVKEWRVGYFLVIVLQLYNGKRVTTGWFWLDYHLRSVTNQAANLVVQPLETRQDYADTGAELSERVVHCFFAHFSVWTRSKHQVFSTEVCWFGSQACIQPICCTCKLNLLPTSYLSASNLIINN